MEIESGKKRSGAAVIVLLAVILLQTVYVCLCFAVERKGIYSDEVWCYGLANSHYKPFIYAPDGFRANYIDDNDLYDNFNEPVSGAELRDYITVQPGERFDYASVYHNQSLDCHPVLYYMLLHTVCSFFPDTFSLLFAFIPSVIFLIVTQIYLYRLALLVTRSAPFSLTVCVFFAAIPASLFTFIYLRMYSLLTMLLVMNAFYTTRLVYGGEVARKTIVPVLITAFLAFNTQYSAVAFIGFMTFAVCVYLLVKKGLRQAAAYGTLMLGTLLLFAAVYPAFYDHIFNNQFTGEKHYGLATQLRALLGYITKYTYGIKINLIRGSGVYYVLAAVVLTAAFAAPAVFLFRKSEKMKRVFSGVKAGAAALKKTAVTSSYVPVMILAGIAGVVVFVDLSCDISYTLDGTVRYLMPCYPFVCMLTVLILKLAAENLPVIKRAALPVTAVMILAAAVKANFNDRALFMLDDFPTGVTQAAEVFSGKKAVVIIPEKRFIMTNTCAYLYKSDSVYYVTAKEFKGSAEIVRKNFPDVDYVWVERDNYLLTEGQRWSLVSAGILSVGQAEETGLRSELEADKEFEVFPEEVRERLLDEETDQLTGEEPEIEMMVEANGRMFYVLKCN